MPEIGKFGAEGGSRTRTSLRTLRPERSASTVSPPRLEVHLRDSASIPIVIDATSKPYPVSPIITRDTMLGTPDPPCRTHVYDHDRNQDRREADDRR